MLHYLDNSATTAVDPQVADLIYKTMIDCYGNPSSLHALGLQAEQVVQRAAKQICACIGAKPGEIYFTSGGTEANNLAVFGAAYAKRRTANRIVTTAIEHSSVLESCQQLEKEGFEVVFVKPEQDGTLLAEKIVEAVNDNTSLVTAMLVNNETGAMLDIAEMAKAVHRKNPYTLVHCDAVQAFGKLPVSVRSLGVDLLTASGHKIHAPKGIGFLYKSAKARILPRTFGGEQQRRLRPGTECVPLIAGLGLAAELSCAKIQEHTQKIRELNEMLRERVCKIPEVFLNSPRDASPYVLNISAVGLRSEILLHFLEQNKVYVSSGSACAQGAKSHVLEAMGLDRRRVDSAIRISFSKYSAKEDVEAFADSLILARQKLFRSR